MLSPAPLMETPKLPEQRPLNDAPGETGRAPESVHERLVSRHAELEQRIRRASDLAAALPPQSAREWNAMINKEVLAINANMMANQEEALRKVEYLIGRTDVLLGFQEVEREKQKRGLARFNVEMKEDVYYIHLPYGACGSVAAYIQGAPGSYTTFPYQKTTSGWKWPVRVLVGKTVTISVPNRNGCWSQFSVDGRFGALNLHTLEAVPDAPPPPTDVDARNAWKQERSGSPMEERVAPTETSVGIAAPAPASAPVAAEADAPSPSSIPDAVAVSEPASDSVPVSAPASAEAAPDERKGAPEVAASDAAPDGSSTDSGKDEADTSSEKHGAGKKAWRDDFPENDRARDGTGEEGGGAGDGEGGKTETAERKEGVKKSGFDIHLENISRNMRDQGVPEAEISARIQLLRNVRTGETYFPDGPGKPEIRNPEHWKENEHGSYVPKGSAVEAIRDLWRTKNGIQCNKYSKFAMIKTVIDNADARQLALLDEVLDGLEIPNELPTGGIDMFYESMEPKNGEYFEEGELLPGDQIWFENPYMDRLSSGQRDILAVLHNDERIKIGPLPDINKQLALAEVNGAAWGTEVSVKSGGNEFICKRDPDSGGALMFKIDGVWTGPADVTLNDRYKGEQGSNLFYAGDGRVMGIYDPQVRTIDSYRTNMMGWNSVVDRDRNEFPRPVVDDFKIKTVNRLKTSWTQVEAFLAQRRSSQSLNTNIVEKTKPLSVLGEEELAM